MLEFEWDEQKNTENIAKHGISFAEATEAFSDPKWVLVEDKKHSETENRFFCIGKVGYRIATVRFVRREQKIRIYGAGFWREGKDNYEKENNSKI